jgi:hypothetical protein
MGILAPAQVTVEIAKGGLSTPVAPGGFVGCAIEWDDLNHEFKGFNPWPGPDGTAGIVWEPGLKAAILAYQIEGHDIGDPAWPTLPGEPMFDSGATDKHGDWHPAAFRWDLRDTVDPRTGGVGHRANLRGEWYPVRPDGAANCQYSAWQVKTLDNQQRAYLRSLDLVPRNRPFWVTLLPTMTQAPKSDEEALAEAERYIAVRFGRQWELHWPASGHTQLRKMVAGTWTTVAEWDWGVEFHQSESSELRGLAVCLMPLDGKLVLKASTQGGTQVYQDDRPFNVEAGEIVFLTRGKFCWFGLHEVAFATGGFLVAEEDVQLAYRPSEAPTPVVIGNVPAGATAEVGIIDLSGPEPAFEAADTRTRLRMALRMAPTPNGRETPVVRMIGLDYAAEAILPDTDWEDVSANLVRWSGRREYRVEERQLTGACRVTVYDTAGAYRTVRGARLLRVSRGREGDLVTGYTGMAAINPAAGSDLAMTVDWEMIDPVAMLDDIPVGRRRPVDGYPVAALLREALHWGYIPDGLIGALYDSGARLPISGYAQEYWGGAPAGMMDGGQAAVQFPETTSVGEVVRYAMGFDYGTIFWWDPLHCAYRYGRLRDLGVERTFEETEQLDALDVVRHEASRRPAVREVVTQVEVVGRERKKQRPISAFAWDRAALQDGDADNFRGSPKGKRETDHALGEQRLCNLRCRYLFEWGRRLREERSFEALGQDLWVPMAIRVHELRSGGWGDYYLLAVTEEGDREGKWETHLEAAVWAGGGNGG